MDFVAIDFETANESPSSACQLGAIVVEKGQFIAKSEWFIRPEPFRFSAGNIAVHGIIPSRVADELCFDGVWDEIRSVLQGRILVAHNARFDIGVLRACLVQFGLEIPAMEFSCTRALARRAWPGLPSYGLRALADLQGIQFRHHDALEDAEACAKLVNAIARDLGAGDFRDLEQRLGLTRGRAGAWGAGGPRFTSMGKTSFTRRDRRGAEQLSAKHHRVFQRRLRFDSFSVNDSGTANQDIQPRVTQGRSLLGDWHENSRESVECEKEITRLRERAARSLAFQQKNVVFTGNLKSVQREEAENLVHLAGGRCSSSVTRRTHVLIVGQPDARTLRAGRTHSTKEERALTLMGEGQSIEILSELQFYSRLKGNHESILEEIAVQRSDLCEDHVRSNADILGDKHE